jgi:hypothetical protein
MGHPSSEIIIPEQAVAVRPVHDDLVGLFTGSDASDNKTCS